ncbi:hypothetical protein HDU99_002551, partial [Rhizoclosmatium hyalinum]
SARRRKIKKVIYAASSTYYGRNALPNTETDAPDFLTPYAASKYEGEIQMRTFNDLFGVPTVSLRFFMVYGPRQPSTGAYAIVTGVFAKQAGLGEPLTIEGKGDHSRDFIHVKDITEGLIIAQQSSVTGEVINLGTGIDYSVKQVADLVSPKQVHVAERKNDLKATLADTCKMKKVLGYQPNKDFISEMSQVAKETMAGSIFAQSWVDKEVTISVPWLLPARAKAVPWFGKDKSLDSLLESLFGLKPSNPFVSLVFMPNAEDINQKSLLLNNIYSLVAIGKSQYYIVGTDASNYQECQNLNLPCWNISELDPEFNKDRGLSRLQAANWILKKGVDVHVGSISTSYLREVQSSYDKFATIDIVMSESLGTDINYVLRANPRTVRMISSLKTSADLPEVHLLDTFKTLLTECSADKPCKERANDTAPARFVKFHHPTTCVSHADACKSGGLYSTVCLERSDPMKVNLDKHDTMYLTQCPSYLDICDIQQIMPKIWTKGQLKPLQCSGGRRDANLLDVSPQKGYLSESGIVEWSRGALKKMLLIHELLDQPKAEAIMDELQARPHNVFSVGFPNGFDTSRETLFLITGTFKRPLDDWRADRRAFMGRHITQMKRQEEANAIHCQFSSTCRQLVWVIVEDSDRIDPEVESLLRCSKISYVYFAYGPTKHYGNAQKNALIQYVVELTRAFNFHGPVHPVDDDGYGLAEGYELCYNVKKWSLLPIVGL